LHQAGKDHGDGFKRGLVGGLSRVKCRDVGAQGIAITIDLLEAGALVGFEPFDVLPDELPQPATTIAKGKIKGWQKPGSEFFAWSHKNLSLVSFVTMTVSPCIPGQKSLRSKIFEWLPARNAFVCAGIYYYVR